MLLRECAVLCDQLVQFEAGSRALGKAEAVQCAAIEIQGLRETQQKLDLPHQFGSAEGRPDRCTDPPWPVREESSHQGLPGLL